MLDQHQSQSWALGPDARHPLEPHPVTLVATGGAEERLTQRTRRCYPCFAPEIISFYVQAYSTTIKQGCEQIAPL